MSYDPQLANRLSALTTEKFAGEVFRATTVNADATAPSLTGGRWAWPQNSGPGTSILYTCFEFDGAVAEVASFLAEQTPIPGPRKIKVTRLSVTCSKIVRFTRDDLESLGVDMTRYGTRDYPRTQEIGSTLAWLGLDGLIAPSARWDCDNLMIFADNHDLNEKLEPRDHQLIEWREWANQHGILKARGI